MVSPPHLDEIFGHLLRRTQQRHTLLWSQELNGDLTGPQYALLSAIGSRPGLDQRSAGALASLDRSTTADVVMRLERNGWIRRDRSLADARRTILSLTTPTRSALAEVTRGVQRVQEGLLRPLSTRDRPIFTSLLTSLAYVGDVPPDVRPELAPDAELLLALSTTPGHLVRRTQQVHQRLWSLHVGAAVTPSQYALLTSIAWEPDDQTSAGVRASLDKSSAADVVARLKRLGLISIDSDSADRRRKIVSLATTGRALLTKVTTAVLAVQKELLAPLSAAEASRMLELIRRVAYQEITASR